MEGGGYFLILTTLSPQTPRRKPRAILRDSLSSLVPKEDTGRAPSHAPDSDEATEVLF